MTRFAIALLLLFAVPARGASASPTAAPVEAGRAEIEELQRSVVDGLRLAPALATSPFLGLAIIEVAAVATGGESAAASSNPIVVRIRDDRLVVSARRHASWPFAGLLVALAAMSVALRMHKLSKPVAAVFVPVEFVLAFTAVGSSILTTIANATRSPAVIERGMMPMPSAAFLGTVLVLSVVAVMMAVRLAFDVLIWISPFPFVDALFEGAKLLFTVGFILIVALVPAFALVLAGIALVVSLLLLRWSVRWVELVVGTAIAPRLRWLGSLSTELVQPRALQALGRHAPADAEVALAARALSVPGVPRRAFAIVVRRRGAGAQVLVPRWVRAPRVIEVAAQGETLALRDGMLWRELWVMAADDAPRVRLALPSAGPPTEALARALGATVLPATAAQRALKWMGAG